MSSVLNRPDSVHAEFSLGFESIYIPKIRDHLRGLFMDRSVLMMDLDGVLTAPGPEQKAPYAAAIEALRELDKSGYLLTLWTQTSDRFMDVSLFLKRAKIGNLFSVVITEENLALDKPQQKRDFEAAIDTADWLDGDTKNNFRKLAHMDIKGLPKTPYLFRKQCGIVDDCAMPWYKNLSSNIIDSMQRRDASCPYPLFEVADTREHVDAKKPRHPSEYFGLSWVERIKKQFPVR